MTRKKKSLEGKAALLLVCELGEMVVADDLLRGSDDPPEGFVRRGEDGSLEPGLVLEYEGRSLLVLVRERRTGEALGEQFLLAEADTEKVALSLLRGLAKETK